MKKKISRRQFIETTAKTGLMVGATFGIGSGRIFASPEHFDLVIKNGLIVDGLNNKPYKSDLGIIADRIEAVEDLNSASSKSIIDAKGKVVSPGFIDIHSHSETELLINPKAESKIRQGVTTELGGNCAHSPFPRKKPLTQFEKELKEKINLDFDWIDLEGYHSKMEKRGIAVNHGTLVGQGTIRHFVMENARREPTVQEMDAQKKLVTEAMAQGAFGLSTGLEYIPSRFASADEIIELCQIVSKYGGFYATHMRSEDTQLMEAVAEAIYIAERVELPLQIKNICCVHYLLSLLIQFFLHYKRFSYICFLVFY